MPEALTPRGTGRRPPVPQTSDAGPSRVYFLGLDRIDSPFVEHPEPLSPSQAKARRRVEDRRSRAESGALGKQRVEGAHHKFIFDADVEPLIAGDHEQR